MIGWWTGFPYFTSMLICLLGGVLGVMYSIPLRRALVTDSPLPYPEGVACAEVLRVGAGDAVGEAQGAAETRAGLAAVVWGSLLSAGWAVLQATRLAAESVTRTFRLGAGPAATGYDIGVLMALYGVGHLVGLSVGVAMLAGLLIAWAGAVPVLTSLHAPLADTAALVSGVWRTQVRFMGAGAIGVAAIWALVRLARPVLGGPRLRHGGQPRTRRGRRRELGGGGARHTDRLGGRRHRRHAGGDHRADRPLRRRRGAWRRLARAGDRRPRLRVADGLLRGRGVRLHGRAHRLVQQPDLGGRHPGGAGRRAAARRGREGATAAEPRPRAGRLRPVRDRASVHRRDHLQRQPAGPQDRPARRRDAVEAAGRADRGRRGGRGGDPASARPAQRRLRLRRRPRSHGAGPARAPGGADLVACQRACSGASSTGA